MIVIEESAVEQDALAGRTYIAIPMEIYQSGSEAATVTVYSACRDIAEKFISVCGADPFQKSLLEKTSRQIKLFMEKFGYRFDTQASQTILEYTAKDICKTPKIIHEDIAAIKTIDEWMRFENKTGAEPDFGDEERDIAFAIVKNDAIVSCACTNDAFYANGAAEIYVETAPEHQNQGFGTACTGALVSFLFQKGIPVWYKCYESNYASAAIAQKCGMKLDGKRISFVCYADE